MQPEAVRMQKIGDTFPTKQPSMLKRPFEILRSPNDSGLILVADSTTSSKHSEMEESFPVSFFV